MMDDFHIGLLLNLDCAGAHPLFSQVGGFAKTVPRLAVIMPPSLNLGQIHQPEAPARESAASIHH